MDTKKKQILITVTAMVCVAAIACAVGVGVSLQTAAPGGSDVPQPGSSSVSDDGGSDGTSAAEPGPPTSDGGSAGQPSGASGGGTPPTAGGAGKTTAGSAVTKTTRVTEQPNYPAEINVVTYGADPTGKTDATAVLTRLHATGKKIYYPNGTYLFNGLTLDFSGGVRFQSKDGVLIRNRISDTPIVNFDDAGNLIGLMHNHLETNNEEFSGVSGNLVSPPLSTRTIERKVDVLPYWYNDFGLQCTKIAKTGWIGWYYWTWDHHDAAKRELDGKPLDAYDPSRHPLLGFYRGDDPKVLDWQCYWLREYGMAGASLLLSGSGLTGWEQPTHRDHWVYQLFTNTPNFKNIRYVMSGEYSFPKAYDAANEKRVRENFFALVDKIYSKYDNYYYVERDGKRYPVISIIAESSYPTIFGSTENVKSFYRELAARFRKAGFGGMALYINWPVKDIGDMTADGVLRYTTSYTPNYTVTDRTGKYTYADLVANFKPPKKGNVIISVGTSVHTQRPHESGWICPGSTPALFAQYMKKAVAQLEKYPALPQVIMCYNMSEWAEGGPGLVPNVRDRFGYLEAIRDAVVKK